MSEDQMLEERLLTLERQVESLRANVHGDGQLWATLRDVTQQLDTAQTPFLKRLKWWLWDGWPWTNWNAERPNWRPTNPRRKVR
jgi:hypothetical protein